MISQRIVEHLEILEFQNKDTIQNAFLDAKKHLDKGEDEKVIIHNLLDPNIPLDFRKSIVKRVKSGYNEHLLDEAFDDFQALHDAYQKAYSFIKTALDRAKSVLSHYGIPSESTEIENVGWGGSLHNRRLYVEVILHFKKVGAEDPKGSDILKDLDSIPGVDADLYLGKLSIANG